MRGLRIAASSLALLLAFGSGEVSAPWRIPAALAQQTVTVEKLSIETGLGTIRIPKLEAEGSSVSAVDIQQLFNATDWNVAAERVGAVSATRWTIPEVIFEQKLGQVNQTVTYKSIVLEEIANGRVGRMNVAGTDISSVLPDGQKMTGRMGAISATGVDLAASIRVMTTTASDPNAPLIPITESYVADGYEFGMGDLMQVKVGIISGRDFRMRPLSTPMTDLVKNLMSAVPANPGEQPTPEQQAKVMAMLPSIFEIYKAYAIGEAELRDMSISVKSPEPVSFSIARVGMKDFANARMGEMSVEGISMQKAGSDGGTFALGKFTLRGLDFAALLADLQTLMQSLPAPGSDPATPPPQLSPASFHMPHFDEIAIDGLDFDGMIKSDPADPTKQERLKMSLGKMGLTVRKWSNLMPTSFGFVIDKLYMEPDPADEKFAQMRAAGIDKIDMSFATSLDYDETAQRVTLENLGFDMAGVGKFGIKGTIENIPPETFSGDPAAAQMAMALAAVKSLDIEVTDGGAIALGLAQQSAATGMPADQLREQMAAMPIAALPQILGQSQEVMDLAQAVSTFVKSGGTLKIAASSLAGVGMLDMGNIPAIMDKAEITATIAP